MPDSATPAPELEGDTAASPPGSTEPPAFERLYTSHFGFTWRVLGHLGISASSLDDAVQEVWIVVHRRLPSFEGRSSLKTWLFGIAMNVARNLRRADERRVRNLPEPDQSPPLDPETLRIQHEAWEHVQRFLDTLDEQRRAIFVSNIIENLSAAETAEAVGADVMTVYKRVRSLRHAFQVWHEQQLAAERSRTP
jgi:RNA polymerase sigma-70 factor, ECF subfamily